MSDLAEWESGVEGNFPVHKAVSEGKIMLCILQLELM